jgi:hypothetical protein
MDTVTLTGTTIRGSVNGRTINCSVRSAPAGLKLPPGQYVLKASPNNPVHGPTVAIESAGATASTATAVATLAPPGVAVSHHKFTPPGSAPGIMKLTPGAPGAIKVAPGAPQTHKIAPRAVKDAPAEKVDFAPSWKWDGAPGQSPQRVLIGSQAIGENCFVAMAGFADLVDAVQQAGAVTLVVK